MCIYVWNMSGLIWFDGCKAIAQSDCLPRYNFYITYLFYYFNKNRIFISASKNW